MAANNCTTTFYFQEDFLNDWRRFETLTVLDPRFKNKSSDNKRGVASRAIRSLIKAYNKKYTGEFLAKVEKEEPKIDVTTKQEEQNDMELESDTSDTEGSSESPGDEE